MPATASGEAIGHESLGVPLRVVARLVGLGLSWEFGWRAQVDLNHRPHLYQLNSGRHMTKVREVNEGACEWMRPAGRALAVVTWCCQLVPRTWPS